MAANLSIGVEIIRVVRELIIEKVREREREREIEQLLICQS